MKEQLLLPVHLGQTVAVQGYRFIVADVWDAVCTNTGANGRRAVYFIGVCTPDKINDSIRELCYNGGVYSLGFIDPAPPQALYFPKSVVGALPQIPLVCDDCGTHKDVEHSYCPYARDVHGEDKPADLCLSCYHSRADDI